MKLGSFYFTISYLLCHRQWWSYSKGTMSYLVSNMGPGWIIHLQNINDDSLCKKPSECQTWLYVQGTIQHFGSCNCCVCFSIEFYICTVLAFSFSRCPSRQRLHWPPYYDHRAWSPDQVPCLLAVFTRQQRTGAHSGGRLSDLWPLPRQQGEA